MLSLLYCAPVLLRCRGCSISYSLWTSSSPSLPALESPTAPQVQSSQVNLRKYAGDGNSKQAGKQEVCSSRRAQRREHGVIPAPRPTLQARPHLYPTLAGVTSCWSSAALVLRIRRLLGLVSRRKEAGPGAPCRTCRRTRKPQAQHYQDGRYKRQASCR